MTPCYHSIHSTHLHLLCDPDSINLKAGSQNTGIYHFLYMAEIEYRLNEATS